MSVLAFVAYLPDVLTWARAVGHREVLLEAALITAVILGAAGLASLTTWLRIRHRR